MYSDDPGLLLLECRKLSPQLARLSATNPIDQQQEKHGIRRPRPDRLVKRRIDEKGIRGSLGFIAQVISGFDAKDILPISQVGIVLFRSAGPGAPLIVVTFQLIRKFNVLVKPVIGSAELKMIGVESRRQPGRHPLVIAPGNGAVGVARHPDSAEQDVHIHLAVYVLLIVKVNDTFFRADKYVVIIIRIDILKTRKDLPRHFWEPRDHIASSSKRR